MLQTRSSGPTVGDARKAWRAGSRTASSLQRQLAWPYPVELLDALLRSPHRNAFPDRMDLVAAAVEAQRLATRHGEIEFA